LIARILQTRIWNRAYSLLSTGYRASIPRIFQEKKVKKILAIFAVTLMAAGCSSMGGIGSSSGASGYSATNSSTSGTPLHYQRQMFDSNGQLSIYHGG
jgi:hypothetical protein